MNILFDDFSATKDHAFRGVGTYARALRSALEHELAQKKYPLHLLSVGRRENADLIHYPHFDFFFPTLSPPKLTPFVVTVHDVIPLIFPKQYRPGLKGAIHFWKQKRMLQKAKAVITDSLCSKKDIIRYLGIQSDRVHVTYLAGNTDLHPQTKRVQATVMQSYGITKPYFLYVGDMNYNKNLPAMVKAFHLSGVVAELVLVGRNLGNTQIPEGKALHDAIHEGKGVVHVLTNIPSTPSEILSALFSGAVAYIQPSLYEGFGLSVLDAFRCGCPVLSSNASSLPEVGGVASNYFSPAKVDEMSQAFRRAYSWTPEQRRRRIEAGKIQESQFSWEQTARQTLTVYLQVLIEAKQKKKSDV